MVRNKDFLKFEHHTASVSQFITSKAKAVLSSAFWLYQPYANVDIKQKAGKHMHDFAAADCAPGTVKLIPYSSSVSHTNREGENNNKYPNGAHVKLTLQMKSGGGKYEVVFSAASAPKADKSVAKPFAKELLVPYWMVQSTNNKEAANMQESKLTLHMTLATDNEDEPSIDEFVKIPILTNTKPVQVGDELIVYKGPASVTPQTLPPAAPPRAAAPKKRVAPVAKRLHQPKKKAMRC